MKEMVLLGDEAIAMGAIDAGISAAYGYPGTPSTEIMEFLQGYARQQKHPYAVWCINEKTAYEEALGVSMVGKRVIVTMKHVGLNVAADPFMNSSFLKIKGGLVLAVADDPGMHSSQNEQDSRYYADFAKIICLEPRYQQEAYEMTREAFELSEKFNIPVMIRLVTRLAHSRATVKVGNPRKENSLHFEKNKRDLWITLPDHARKMYIHLIEQQNNFAEYTENSNHNPLIMNKNFKSFGIITTGLGCNYYEDNFEDLKEKPSHLHISAYPMPIQKIRTLAEQVDKILVIEEGYPFVERFLRGILPQKITIAGKMDKTIPFSGELTPDDIRRALGLPFHPKLEIEKSILPTRPPQLCKGCPHIDTFIAINEALQEYKDPLVTSDIGCYSLAALPPLSAIDSIVCMGASIGMAKGAAEMGYHPVIATIGDSTFQHSGITPLIDAISLNANMTVIILDNSTTGMTGGQEVIIGTPRILKLLEGIGVSKEHIRVIIPIKNKHTENVEIIKKEIEYMGLSVIIALRECIQTLQRKTRQKGE